MNMHFLNCPGSSFSSPSFKLAEEACEIYQNYMYYLSAIRIRQYMLYVSTAEVYVVRTGLVDDQARVGNQLVNHVPATQTSPSRRHTQVTLLGGERSG